MLFKLNLSGSSRYKCSLTVVFFHHWVRKNNPMTKENLARLVRACQISSTCVISSNNIEDPAQCVHKIYSVQIMFDKVNR